MARVLVAEDAQDVRENVRSLLESEYHEVCEARDGHEALQEYSLRRPDLVLLDTVLPGENGYDVCRRIRMVDPATPILILSAKADEADKVLGLGLGADDYVTRPFGVHELVARVSALLRRAGVQRRLSDLPVREDFRFGSARVAGRELALVESDGRRTPLSAREYALLHIFASRPNEVIFRKDLFDYVWGRGAYAYSRTLDTHVWGVRRKIADTGWSIETVSGHGYRLQTSVDAP